MVTTGKVGVTSQSRDRDKSRAVPRVRARMCVSRDFWIILKVAQNPDHDENYRKINLRKWVEETVGTKKMWEDYNVKPVKRYQTQQT